MKGKKAKQCKFVRSDSRYDVLKTEKVRTTDTEPINDLKDDQQAKTADTVSGPGANEAYTVERSYRDIVMSGGGELTK